VTIKGTQLKGTIEQRQQATRMNGSLFSYPENQIHGVAKIGKNEPQYPLVPGQAKD